MSDLEQIPTERNAQQDSVAGRVYRVIRGCLGPSATELGPSDRLADDLEMDSLELPELTLDLEDEFGQCLTEDEAGKIVTIADLIVLFQRNIEGE